ncbi:pleckstrin homology domain-containing family S member 1 isoform X3 [Accipiter gentilis]|uniref:pleckstrin homology domain-containing family S member 1 isoform X3 n=1 Tax=Astur gentilis TaxID=8957 RepID=UPI0021107248|nr:pleckstrin homology domain-containing family S member 1 isoform X3 [Accipiter gentilis]
MLLPHWQQQAGNRGLGLCDIFDLQGRQKRWMLPSEPRSSKSRSQKPALLFASILEFCRYDQFPGKPKLPEGEWFLRRQEQAQFRSWCSSGSVSLTKRSFSKPVFQVFMKAEYHSGHKGFKIRSPDLQDKNLGKSEENLLSSDTDEDIKKDEEDYYQTPSNILAKRFQQCTTEVSKPDPTAESDVPVEEKPVRKNPVKDNIYMSMKSLRLLDENCQLMCRRDGVPCPPKCQDNSACPRDLEANRDLKFPESSTSQQPTLQRRKNSLPLSVVQLSILLSQITDETQLQNLDIFIPLADINSYLKLTEAAGQICISQWTGPCRLGCLFNHGDHIVAVNDLQPQNVEEAYFFISRSTRKEVKLTVCRIPHSDIFHAKGCSCS